MKSRNQVCFKEISMIWRKTVICQLDFNEKPWELIRSSVLRTLRMPTVGYQIFSIQDEQRRRKSSLKLENFVGRQVVTRKVLNTLMKCLQNVVQKRDRKVEGRRRTPLAVPSIQLNSIPACSWYHWGRHLNPHCRSSLIVSPFVRLPTNVHTYVSLSHPYPHL